MTFTLCIFALVYVGMMLGRVPGLLIDRTGVALLGGLALIAGGVVSTDQAWQAIDVPTMALLFGLMVVSAQFRLGGFYGAVTRRVATAPFSPRVLLALLLAVVAGLSALLTNDIICLAMTPLLAEGCLRRRLNPVPFLLGLACAANIGSAATLIGNPQNILIGQSLSLDFGAYLLQALPPVLASLAACWAVLVWLYRGRWHTGEHSTSAEARPFNAWQTGKGLIILVVLLLVFLFTTMPREVAALGAAGILLISRRMNTREMLGLVDWHLLVLFMGLFVVNHAFEATGAMNTLFDAIRSAGVEPEAPLPLFIAAAVLSNLVSNVPAVMLLLHAATHPQAGLILALSSSFAGNLIIVGSIANIIVIEQSRLLGIPISWREHARAGIPVTLISLALAGAWLALATGLASH